MTLNPYRTGNHWGVTIVHETWDEDGTPTGELLALATSLENATRIVDALNEKAGRDEQAQA